MTSMIAAFDALAAASEEQADNLMADLEVLDTAITRLTRLSTDMVAALERAESFISGFEDDENQEGIPDLLETIRDLITRAKMPA